jgi:hypothetical protein
VCAHGAALGPPLKMTKRRLEIVQHRSALPQEHSHQADEAGKEGLVQVGVLLQGLALHHGRQLVVVADEHDALEARLAALRRVLVLQKHGDQSLHLVFLCE